MVDHTADLHADRVSAGSYGVELRAHPQFASVTVLTVLLRDVLMMNVSTYHNMSFSFDIPEGASHTIETPCHRGCTLPLVKHPATGDALSSRWCTLLMHSVPGGALCSR